MSFSWTKERKANYQRNLELLREKDKKIYQKMLQLVPDGAYCLQEEGNYPNLYYKDAPYYHMPFFEEIRDSFGQVNLQKARMLIFWGFGLGYAYQYFTANLRNENWLLQVFLVEPSLTAFYLAMHLYPMDNLLCDPKVVLAVGLEPQELYGYFLEELSKEKRFYQLKALDTFVEQGAISLCSSYFEEAKRAFETAGTDAVLAFGNSPEDSLIGVEHMFLNREIIAYNPGILLCKDAFKGKPAVVVATGPSLNKNKELLKGLEDKAVIICVDASFKILMEMGVKPHFIASLERVSEVVSLLSGYEKEQVEEIYLTATPVVSPQVYESYPGPKFIIYRNFAHFAWLENEKGTLQIKQSAGNMAFSIGEYLGCDPILLIGQDLAYGEDFLTHAKGMVFGEKDDSHQKEEKIQVKGNVSPLVYTNKWWDMFRKSYVRDVKNYHGTCVNCTEGGAFIEGTQVMPFQEAIEKYLQASFPIRTVLKDRAKVEKNIPEKYLKKWDKKFKKMMQSLSKMDTLLEEEAKRLEREWNKVEKLENGELRPHLESMKRAVRLAEQRKREFSLVDQETFQNIVMHVIQAYWIMYEMSFAAGFSSGEREEVMLKELLRKYYKFFQVHLDMIKEIRSRLSKVA